MWGEVLQRSPQFCWRIPCQDHSRATWALGNEPVFHRRDWFDWSDFFGFGDWNKFMSKKRTWHLQITYMFQVWSISRRRHMPVWVFVRGFQESFYGNNLGFWSEVVVKSKDGSFFIQCVIKSLKWHKNRVNHSQMAGLFSDWHHKRQNSIKHVQNSLHISSSSLDQKKSLTYLRLLGLLHGDESSWRVAGQSLFTVADESQTGVKRHHLLTVPADHSYSFRSASCTLTKRNTLIVVGDVTTISCCCWIVPLLTCVSHMHCIASRRGDTLNWHFS